MSLKDIQKVEEKRPKKKERKFKNLSQQKVLN